MIGQHISVINVEYVKIIISKAKYWEMGRKKCKVEGNLTTFFLSRESENIF